MIKRFLLTAIVTVFATGLLSSPAFAGHCPKDVKLIKAAMSKMDDKKMSMAKDAADKGLALHKAGKHGDAIKVLHAAMEANGIKHLGPNGSPSLGHPIKPRNFLACHSFK